MAESLATGAKLDSATFADFITRLRHDCVGEGVREHCTSHALFLVEKREIIYGLDLDYTDERVVLDHTNDREWFSPQEFWDEQEDEERADINKAMQAWAGCQFMKATESNQWRVLGELRGLTVTGWAERWEYVNSHFTQDAADAFIARKKHDYRKGMRVAIESQYWAWEFEAIKGALLSGALVLKSEQV